MLLYSIYRLVILISLVPQSIGYDIQLHNGWANALSIWGLEKLLLFVHMILFQVLILFLSATTFFLQTFPGFFFLFLVLFPPEKWNIKYWKIFMNLDNRFSHKKVIYVTFIIFDYFTQCEGHTSSLRR